MTGYAVRDQAMNDLNITGVGFTHNSPFFIGIPKESSDVTIDAERIEINLLLIKIG